MSKDSIDWGAALEGVDVDTVAKKHGWKPEKVSLAGWLDYVLTELAGRRRESGGWYPGRPTALEPLAQAWDRLLREVREQTGDMSLCGTIPTYEQGVDFVLKHVSRAPATAREHQAAVKPREREWIRRITMPERGLTVRLWIQRHETDLSVPLPGNAADTEAGKCAEWIMRDAMNAPVHELADGLLDRFERLNAVQVSDQREAGAVVYRDWP